MTTNEEARDQWGETAEERHSRILTRDLAWLTYADECARDGVPRNERDHLIFNHGWAAAYSNITTLAAPDHQAEAERREVFNRMREIDEQLADHQAEAPTDEEALELEVQDLATVIGNVVIDYEETGPHSQRPITIRDTCSDWPMEIAGEVQAHGFRLAARPVVDDAAVERAARALHPGAFDPDVVMMNKERRRQVAILEARAALRAALEPEKGER